MGAVEPITSYPETYQQMNRASREQIADGLAQLISPPQRFDPVRDAAPPDSSAWRKAKGVTNVGLGTLDYVTSPINAALRTFVGESTQRATGIPKEYIEFATGMALPPGRIPRLPMDYASRMARAKQMGFRTDMPLAHGTASDFSEFDLDEAGRMSRAAPARMGVSAEVRPSMTSPSPIADEFAERASKLTSNPPRILPLLHRAENPASLTLTGDEMNHEIAATLADAWERGHDSVLLRNYTSPGGQTGDILVVKDPAQLRAPTAQFDPVKRNSRNLLAGTAGVSVLPFAGDGERMGQ